MNKVTTICFAIITTLSITTSLSFAQEIQRVRVDFTNPNGYIRHLLLGFTPNNAANDNYNYGYDAVAFNELPDDLLWMIEDKRCVIQGVGAFSTDKFYPFGMFIDNSGSIAISLVELENFDQPIDVFIYDAITNVFQLINDIDFTTTIDSGDHLNRFFITFQNAVPPSTPNESLSVADTDLSNIILKSIPASKELLVDTRNSSTIEKVEILDILGKKVANIKQINASKIRIPTQHINSRIVIVSVFTNKGIVRKKIILH